jgi:hypothetical protein
MAEWMPGKRIEQLAMAKNWAAVLKEKGTGWGIPSAEAGEFEAMAGAAETALSNAMSTERNQVTTAICAEAFTAMTEKMRHIKKRYFLSPPLTHADYALLGLKEPDGTSTSIPPPTGQAEADITRPGVHLLGLRLRPVTGAEPDPRHADYGYRVYWGVLPPGGASVEAATGTKRELMAVPVSGKQLPFSRFTRRHKELLDFDAEDSGKTAYFCVQYENAKGEQGPWGPIFSAVIP